MDSFKQCEYVFNKGSRKGSKCSAKTLNQYCKKHSKTKTAQGKIVEIPIDNNENKEIKIEEVDENKKKV